jgi:hypothetical protein
VPQLGCSRGRQVYQDLDIWIWKNMESLWRALRQKADQNLTHLNYDPSLKRYKDWSHAWRQPDIYQASFADMHLLKIALSYKNIWVGLPFLRDSCSFGITGITLGTEGRTPHVPRKSQPAIGERHIYNTGTTVPCPMKINTSFTCQSPNPYSTKRSGPYRRNRQEVDNVLVTGSRPPAMKKNWRDNPMARASQITSLYGKKYAMHLQELGTQGPVTWWKPKKCEAPLYRNG